MTSPTVPEGGANGSSIKCNFTLQPTGYNFLKNSTLFISKTPRKLVSLSLLVRFLQLKNNINLIKSITHKSKKNPISPQKDKNQGQHKYHGQRDNPQ